MKHLKWGREKSLEDKGWEVTAIDSFKVVSDPDTGEVKYAEFHWRKPPPTLFTSIGEGRTIGDLVERLNSMDQSLIIDAYWVKVKEQR